MSRPAVARLAVYAGSFDPVTLGHLDLIERASALFSDVIVAVGVHPTRYPLFSVEERLSMLEEVTKPMEESELSMASPPSSSQQAPPAAAAKVQTDQPAMFCNKCGARNPTDSSFCSKCGAKIGE